MDADDPSGGRCCVRIADVDFVASAKAAWIRGYAAPDEQAAVRVFLAPELRGHLEVRERRDAPEKTLRPRLFGITGRRDRLRRRLRRQGAVDDGPADAANRRPAVHRLPIEERDP